MKLQKVKNKYKTISTRAALLLKRGEGTDVDWKRTLKFDPEDIVAFANSSAGGAILLGVEEIKGPNGIQQSKIIGKRKAEREKRDKKRKAGQREKRREKSGTEREKRREKRDRSDFGKEREKRGREKSGTGPILARREKSGTGPILAREKSGQREKRDLSRFLSSAASLASMLRSNRSSMSRLGAHNAITLSERERDGVVC